MQGLSPQFFRRVPNAVAAALLVILALVPVLFIAMDVVAASRNIVYWDEFDTVLDLLLTLDSGVDFPGFIERIFAINNEHRMITSRLLFAASWWLTGTVDFRVIGAIGNLFLVSLCVTLILSVTTPQRRLRLGVILACLMFQFEHFENLFWSGASIDHFQVVALAAGSIALIARTGTGSLAGAMLLAVLATFTLAHGLITWLVGAFMLWRDRRRVAFWSWVAAAGLIGFVFFHSFEINSGHPIAGADVEGLMRVAQYWLALVGAPLALGYTALAPYAGLLWIALFGWLWLRGGWREEKVMLPMVLFCVSALGLVAIGRSELAGGLLQSRYVVLSALAWAGVIFVIIENIPSPARTLRFIAMGVPLLAVFNIAANVRFAPAVEAFIEGRDDAALRFKQRGNLDESAAFRLYPKPERANRLLQEAAQRGLYWVPRMCVPTLIPDPQPSSRITYFVDEMTADGGATYVAGWAAIPERKSRRGEIHLIFRSPTENIVYTTVSMSRPDVAAAHSPDWRLCGFHFAVDRSRLPAEELQVGIMIKDGDHAEYVMTDHRLRLQGGGEALLANTQ